MYHQASPFFNSRAFRRNAFNILLLVGILLVVPRLYFLIWQMLPEDSWLFALLGRFWPENPNPKFLASVDYFYTVVLNYIIRVLTILLAGIWCILTTMRLGGSITREREQRTLGSLLLLPVPRWHILGAKWLGNIARYRYFGAALLALWALGLAVGALHPLAVVLLAVALAIHLAFFAALGLWISLASRNSLWANCTTILMLLVVFIGWWIVHVYAQFFFGIRLDGAGWWNSFIEIGLNPARAWWYFSFGWTNWPDDFEVWTALGTNTLAAALAGLGVLGLVAVLHLGLAWLHFRKEEPASSN